uniref:Uncharacterized protein n=1 Tax=Pararge aegeria TaxID=116150 RepID=S4PVL7_9NEOP
MTLRVVKRALFIFDDVARGAGGELTVTLGVRTVNVTLLSHLTRQRIVVGKRCGIPWVMLRRSVRDVSRINNIFIISRALMVASAFD